MIKMRNKQEGERAKSASNVDKSDLEVIGLEDGLEDARGLLSDLEHVFVRWYVIWFRKSLYVIQIANRE